MPPAAPARRSRLRCRGQPAHTGGISVFSGEENESESPGNVQVSLGVSRTVKGKEIISFRRNQ